MSRAARYLQPNEKCIAVQVAKIAFAVPLSPKAHLPCGPRNSGKKISPTNAAHVALRPGWTKRTFPSTPKTRAVLVPVRFGNLSC